MQIERIDRLHECGVFRDFRWAAVSDLQEFGQFNLIYGWNGSGKTTLSRILRKLELRAVPQGGDIELRVSGRRFQGSRFGEVPAETVALKVFNQDFVRDNVFRPDDDGMAPSTAFRRNRRDENAVRRRGMLDWHPLCATVGNANGDNALLSDSRLPRRRCGRLAQSANGFDLEHA